MTKETFTQNFNNTLEILEQELKLSGLSDNKIGNIVERLYADHDYMVSTKF
tara:strand:- start:80 stop:232 length:153 start_codon:yes stop_codon:yes gene_type:complete